MDYNQTLVTGRERIIWNSINSVCIYSNTNFFVAFQKSDIYIQVMFSNEYIGIRFLASPDALEVIVVTDSWLADLPDVILVSDDT